MSTRFFVLLGIVILTGEACHGGGSSSLLPQAPAKGGHASFSVTVPPGTTPAMHSLVVTLSQVNGAPPSSTVAPVTLNLSLKSPGCSPSPSGLRCTVIINAPAGNDTFTIRTYSMPNATGTTVSTTQATTLITAAGNASCTQTTTGLAPATHK